MATFGRNLGLLFPGQGSQYVGMGRDLYDDSPAARAVFDLADARLGRPLSRLCFEGPEDELVDTANAQPAIVTTSVAVLAAIKELLDKHGRTLSPAFVAGHSVGQYAALVAAGVLEFDDAVALVAQRGRLMREAGEHQPGGMAAVIGMDATAVEEVCREAAQEGHVVCAANYNVPDQIVISGSRPGITAAAELAKQRGAKRVVPLAVSVANHSPLMASAANEFARLLDDVPLADGDVPVVVNGSATSVSTASEMHHELRRHMVGPVRWLDSMSFMVKKGSEVFWEIGPGQVLSGMMKRSGHQVVTLSIGTRSGLAALGDLLANEASVVV